MTITSTKAERKRACHLHEVLLFNLIIGHAFLLVVALSFINQSLRPLVLGLSIALSITLLSYIIVKAKRSLESEPSWYVRCHWQLAAKRARQFLFLSIALWMLTLSLFYGGHAMHLKTVEIWAITGAVGIFPFILVILGFITVEFDADYQSLNGKVPSGAIAHCPPPEA